MKHYFFLCCENREQEFPYGGQIILASSIQVYSGEKHALHRIRLGQVIGAMTTTKAISNLV